MGARSRQKGAAGERDAVALCRAAGLDAKRAWWLARAEKPEHRKYDLLVTLPSGETVAVQVKRRRAGYAALYEAVESVAFALVRQDNREWLAVLPADRLLGMLNAAPTVRSQ